MVKGDIDPLDPTVNVTNMLDASVERIDDLRAAEERRLDDLRAAETRRTDDLRIAETRRVDEQLDLRAEYSRQLQEAESKRIDAIRAVDVAAVAVASERATQSASVLANQVAASAETLRTLVASTAVTIAQQLAQLSSQLSDRISTLEKSSYEGIGRGRVADPALSELMAEVRNLREARTTATSTASGVKETWGWLAVVVTIVLSAIGLGVAVIVAMKQGA